MNTSLIFYSQAFIMLGVSAIKDKEKTKLTIKKAYNSFINLIHILVMIITYFIGPFAIEKL